MNPTTHIQSLPQLLAANPYPGRGLAIGYTPDGKHAVIAYFIMGRSANSRNRLFEEVDGDLYTRAFDESKVEDPSLIIYAPLRVHEAPERYSLIATNGDQTDTVYDALAQGRTFEQALATRCFEPDAPNYTPRISGLLQVAGSGESDYRLSILKSVDAEGSACSRTLYHYPAQPGTGHFISTYVTDGDPLPSFEGEPVAIAIPDDIDAFAEELWEHLNAGNKISLYVRTLNLETKETQNVLINRHRRDERDAT